MLDPKLVRTETSEIAEKLAVKKYKFDIELFASLEESRKEIQSRTEELQNERNTRSKSIGKAKAAGEAKKEGEESPTDSDQPTEDKTTTDEEIAPPPVEEAEAPATSHSKEEVSESPAPESPAPPADAHGRSCIL